jgi:hypothetical protein
MIRGVTPTILSAILALSGVAVTAGRTDAQVYYSYYPGTGYYSNAAPTGVYLAPYSPSSYPTQSYPPQTNYSYYTPAADTNAAGYTAVRAWDGGWTMSGYTSPALPYYNSYRATPPGFRR